MIDSNKIYIKQIQKSHVYEEIYGKELAYMIMETENCKQDLPSTTWRPKKTGGVVPV